MIHLASALLAVEEQVEKGGGGLELILPDIAELVWGVVTFVVVVTLLYWKAFPKIKEGINKREQTVQSALEETERARGEAQRMLDEYKQQLGEARAEANRIIEEARQSAEQVRKDLIAKAERDAEGVIERAHDQIQAEQRRVFQDLQGQVKELSIQLAEKVVGRSLDGQAQKELVDAYIAEVSGMSGNGGRA